MIAKSWNMLTPEDWHQNSAFDLREDNGLSKLNFLNKCLALLGLLQPAAALGPCSLLLPHRRFTWNFPFTIGTSWLAPVISEVPPAPPRLTAGCLGESGSRLPAVQVLLPVFRSFALQGIKLAPNIDSFEVEC